MPSRTTSPATIGTWRRLGLDIEEGDAPIEDNFGITPVRLNPDDRGEVVWARRIDPVRARIENVPYPESGFRRGDVEAPRASRAGAACPCLQPLIS